MELYRAFDCAQQLSAISAQLSALRYQYHFSGLSGIVLPSGC